MLGDVIKTQREALNMTQGELARAAKTTQPTISRIETNLQQPSSTLLYKIADVLKLEPALLFEILAVTVLTQEKNG